MTLAEVAIRAVGTFVVATVFYTLTVHLAATYVLEEASIFEALLVGPVPAAISVGLGLAAQSTVPAASAVAVPLVAIPADFLAIAWSYELDRRMAALVTLGHFVVSILLAASLIGLFGGL
ncbi:hypothetical protein L593_02775 [Salinarchaeum sp. Harcht-Bsk1]|uniref:DUF7473 family protein n=1 Tax=Salinarchaeum sp. Harcht-Bsk1 TaxID=1333523 RepID=UPI0003423230|nr:hypothetical protein [Salinarchaeum sp. Harcht-Bsk1]AGN00506.1 hypothetical protein L593_02775 [Salinarchaeum sp. Harcht-Bsk1]